MRKAASVFLRSAIYPEDVEKLTVWLGNRHVTRYLHEDAGTAERLRGLLETVPAPLLQYHFNQNGRFFLVCDAQDAAIGFVTLQRQGNGCYEIVFAIGEEELWGQGCGSGALRAAVSQAFLQARAQKLTAKVYHANLRSIGAVRHCGFREERKTERLSCYTITMDEYLRFLEQKRA